MSELIKKYESAPALLASAIKGLSADDLHWKPPATAKPEVGKWSIQDVVIHLADADFAFADRFKRIIASENPVLHGWSENDFHAKLFYAEQSVDDAVELVRLTHAQMMRVFRHLPGSSYTRSGTHSERGVQTLTDVLTYATWHLEHHVKFIQQKRNVIGK